jgi:hypothetical protein
MRHGAENSKLHPGGNAPGTPAMSIARHRPRNFKRALDLAAHLEKPLIACENRNSLNEQKRS